MRGTRFDFLLDVVKLGITPAYAGNTFPFCFLACNLWDHPRVCGEHARMRTGAKSRTGSPPRMRGTQLEHITPGRYHGITPAYAGNTLSAFWSLSRYRDHPRVCGEHDCHGIWWRDNWGSPPRMRGTPAPRVLRRPRRGITPAYAGNTYSVDRYSQRHRDHPRVCGEHPYTTSKRVNGEGSPPRMRGTPKA